MLSLENFLNPKIQSETSSSEKDLNDAMNKLGHLGQQIKALKTKQANNSMVAAQAKDTATMAQNKANAAKQVCFCTSLYCCFVYQTSSHTKFVHCHVQDLEGELSDKYRSVQDLVGRKANVVQDAKNKAERLRDEAKLLLKDAQDKLHRLAGE